MDHRPVRDVLWELPVSDVQLHGFHDMGKLGNNRNSEGNMVEVRPCSPKCRREGWCGLKRILPKSVAEHILF